MTEAEYTTSRILVRIAARIRVLSMYASDEVQAALWDIADAIQVEVEGSLNNWQPSQLQLEQKAAETRARLDRYDNKEPERD